MLNQKDILSTIHMIDQQHLDVRTITMGISLLDCCDPDPAAACRKIYDKITTSAEHLVQTGHDIETEFGIPIVNKRISVTPMALVAGASRTNDYVPFAQAMDKAAKAVGVNFIGGFSALVQKGMTEGDKKLIAAIPEALAVTDVVCSSVNVGSTKAGINMDAVRLMGETIKAAAERTADRGGFGCAKLVVFCNAVEDNPFMAGAFHGVGEAERVINVGVSGPGVVHHALQSVKGQPFDVVAETIKKTAFQVTRMGQLVAREASARLNVPFGIEDFSYEERGGEPGDLYYSIQLTEWRSYAPSRVTLPEGEVREADRAGAPEDAGSGSYTVVPGDSLWAIARRFYGDGTQWRKLYEANRAVVGANPNLIYPGQVLTIP